MASTRKDHRAAANGDDDDASVASSSTSGSSNKDAAGSKLLPIFTLIDGVLQSAAGAEDTDSLSQTSGEEGVDIERLGFVDDEVDAAAVWTCPGATADGRTCDAPGSDPRCVHSLYGNKVARGEAKDLVGPDLEGGLVWYAQILPNDYDKDGKVRFLTPKDYDAKAGAPKPRRKMPFPLTAAQFFSSIVRIGKPGVETEADAGMDDLWDREVRHSVVKLSRDSARWAFTGVLNGWPGLTCLEVRKIETRETGFVGRRKGWNCPWNVEKEGAQGRDPTYSPGFDNLDVRVKLRAPQWTAHGWSEESPGFLFWVEGAKVGESNPLKVTYGTKLIEHFKCDEDDDPICEVVHMISHRYATGGRAETKKEKLTYHSFALLEWDHQEYCTVVEIGYLNGLGGYRAKSNWYDDKDVPQNELYGAFHPSMVLPWKDTMSEIRCHDVPCRNLEDFKGYIQKYEGISERFIDPQYTFSHEVRLTYRSRRNIATYLLNYIRRDRTYSEMRRNCQTFAADLCGFLAGKKDVQPFHPVNQIQYTCQKHKFLYESSKYKTSGARAKR